MRSADLFVQPMRYLCINVWEHADPLRRAIESARRTVPDVHVVVVDGVYAQFPYQRLGKKPYSTDGTLDAANELADTVIWSKNPWPSEIAKRSSYLIGEDGDWYIHLDADEYMEGLWQDPPKPYQDADIAFFRSDLPARRDKLYRAFQHRPGIVYKNTHATLWSGNTKLNDCRRYLLQNVKIWHSIGVNDEQRTYAKGSYYKWLAEAEKEYR